MKTTTLLVMLLSLFVLGCATTPSGQMAISREVRELSMTDETLFRDLLTQPGGVAHADYISFPRSTQKTLSHIEVIVPYDNVEVGKERWTIEHAGGEAATYLVTLTPDGRGGTFYSVQRELSASGGPVE